jgi:hypothetical protein
MNFDADRLARLAGLPVSNRGTLNEAGNRSRHEDSDPEGETLFRYGKNQLAEEQKYGGNKGDESRSRRDDMDEEAPYGGNKGDESRSKRDYMDEEAPYGGNKGDESRSKRDYMDEEAPYGGNKGDESRSKRDFGEGRKKIQIDEKMLRKEIARMRKERLQENELRKVIRAEIGSILKDIKPSRGSKVKESRKSKLRRRRGRNLRDAFSGITTGFPGPGFR